MTTDDDGCGMCPGCYCRENHEKVTFQHPDGYPLTIDRGLSTLAILCMGHSVQVTLGDLCCEATVIDGEQYVELDFVSMDDLEHFLSAIARDETLYQLAMGHEPEWMYRVAPIDLGMESHTVAGERLEVRQAEPDVSCAIFMAFPVAHLQMVVDVLNTPVRR